MVKKLKFGLKRYTPFQGRLTFCSNGDVGRMDFLKFLYEDIDGADRRNLFQNYHLHLAFAIADFSLRISYIAIVAWLFPQYMTSLTIAGLALMIRFPPTFVMCRRRSVLTNMYFNQKTGVITFRGYSAGGKRKKSKIYINIPPDFGQFEMDKNGVNLCNRSKILSEPPKKFVDKWSRLIWKDNKLVPRVREFGLYVALNGLDLSSPYGPLEGHLFMIEKDDYDGMVQFARRSYEFRKTKFGAAFLQPELQAMHTNLRV